MSAISSRSTTSAVIPNAMLLRSGSRNMSSYTKPDVADIVWPRLPMSTDPTSGPTALSARMRTISSKYSETNSDPVISPPSKRGTSTT